MKGFTCTQHQQKTAAYWISCYSKENEDDPFSINKKVLLYKPGQDKDKLILEYCRELMRINHNIWEVLVHQGPSKIPANGDQITLRISREKFRGSTTLA